MKPIVLYHANCADGFGAAFAAWRYFGDTAEYKAIAYSDTLKVSDVHDRTVYILDFSFPRTVMDSLFELCDMVVWLDHHKTAFELYGLEAGSKLVTSACIGVDSRHTVLLDNYHSGAFLAWEYFHESPIPLLIHHIDDYDRWQFKIPGTKAFNKYLWSLTPWSFTVWDALLTMPEAELQGAYRAGEAILRAHKQNVQAVLDASKMTCTIIWWAVEQTQHSTDHHTFLAPREFAVNGLAANCPAHLASDVGHALATESGTFGLAWFQAGNSRIKCSLRSNGDYDVSVIAKKFGGGGHKNAAGFEVTIDQLQRWFYPNRKHTE